MNNSKNPVARQSGLVVQEMPDEVLVYDMQTNKAHCLNRSAATVWKSCDGTKTVADIVREFDGKVTEDFVWLAIDQLNENNLLEAGMTPRFTGQSRRQVLKTIGLASMVAIPLISSLVAPKNALGALSCSCRDASMCANLTACQSQTICNDLGLCAPQAPRPA